MTIKHTETIFETKYRDDYNDSDGFTRILFNNGRHLQARELTQSQTIIQKQIERLGRNLFKEGANVNPGGVTLNDKYEFVKLDTGVYSVPSDGSVVGETFLGQNSNVRVKVLESVASSGSDPATIYVEYTNTVNGTVGPAAIRLDPNEDIVGTTTGTILRVQSTNTISNPAMGRGVRFSVSEGSFFVNGFFVHSNAQNFIASKYSQDYTGVLGFTVTQDIVTTDDDASLYDNSQKLPNTTSPGADRFRIKLILSDQADILATDTFVYLAKVVGSKVVDSVTGFNQYNKINELIALRTKEESGDYIVKPFTILFDSENTSSLKLSISDGTAYVNGYRVAKNYPTEIIVPRAQDTAVLENEVVAANFGNYVIADTLFGTLDITNFAEINLNSNNTFSGSTIGTARVRSVDAVGDGTYRVYLFNINMTGSNTFRSVQSVGSSVTNYAKLKLENSLAALKDANNISLLFPLPNERPSNIDDVSYQIQRRFTGVSDASGNLNLSLSATGETFSNTSGWITAVDSSGDIISPTITGTATQSADLSFLPTSSSIEVLAYVNKSQSTIKQKLKNTKTANISTLSTGTGGERYVPIELPDVYEVTYVRQDSANGEDITDQFNLDTGQRDAYYDVSRLVLKGGIAVPSNVYYSVNHFNHTASGDFFAVNSYAGIPYSTIPSYTTQDGTDVDLRNVLDFRPVKNTSGTFSGGAGKVIELPKNTDVITSDITYYLPRSDKLVVDEQGTLTVLSGISALIPKFKDVPSNSLELYRVKLNPFTLNDSDMRTQFIEAKGYTMKDINSIEKRIDRLEETVALSLLEVDTNTFEVIDSNGSNRTKSGFAVDNFVDHFGSDTKNVEYRASINPSLKTLNPIYSEKNASLVYDSANSTNTLIKGDNIYIKHTESAYLTQDQVSTTENVNPFAAFLFNGTVLLSPSSDEWRDVETAAPVVIQGGTRLDTRQELLSGANEWGWNGVDQNGTTVSRVVTSQTIRQVVDDRIIDLTIVPFIRSRKVFFSATGLRPNTRIIPYFDRKDVTVWCKSEAFQNINSNKTSFGNTQSLATAHPSGSSNLFTDDKGQVSGSFFIPNTSAIRFRTGIREFTLLDITSYDLEASSSVAAAAYTAEGVIETRQQTIVSTRRPQPPTPPANRARRTDPLAQSFYVSEETGVFITKARVFFKTKSSTMPVWVQLRPMVNGHPSSEAVIPGSNKILDPASVLISADASVGTDFVFDEPIYLKAKTEYSLVVLADTTDYEAYISKMGDFILNSTEKRITKQPTLGSLFKSQNAATWTPAQLEDLMFTLYRANFEVGTSTAYLENAPLTDRLLTNDAISTISSSNEVKVLHKSNDLLVGDIVTLSGISETIGGITADSMNGNHIITAADGNGYTFDLQPNANKTEAGGSISIIANENMFMDKVFPYVETISPELTSLEFKAKFFSGKSYAGSETAYAEDAIYTTINNKETNYFNAPKLIAHTSKETAIANKTVKFNIDMTTTSNWVSPVIDLQRASIIGISHRIDDQAAAPASGKNVPIVYGSETDPVAGSHLSKHITKPVTLVNDAVGLKILIAANRPSVASIDVYYKTTSADEKLNESNWTLVGPEEEVPSDENREVFRDYRYLVGGPGGTLGAFTVYQLKIVMRSTNSSKVPTIKDLRTIALGI